MVKKRIAIIPARGGSKRLPKKNIMDFQGKPMIAWTIEAALETDLFDSVLVSTDDEEIAKISLRYGAEVPFLRNNYADDQSTVSQATRSALIQMESYKNIEYQTVVQLMANCPLRSSISIMKQLNYFEELNSSFNILSGIRYGMFNPWWAHEKIGDNSYNKIFKHLDNNIRSQDLPKLICPTGATWISERSRLITSETFYTAGYKFFELNWKEGIDIDDQHDLDFADTIFQIIKTNGQN